MKMGRDYMLGKTTNGFRGRGKQEVTSTGRRLHDHDDLKKIAHNRNEKRVVYDATRCRPRPDGR